MLVGLALVGTLFCCTQSLVTKAQTDSFDALTLSHGIDLKIENEAQSKG